MFSDNEAGVYNYTTKILEFMPEGDVRLNPLLEYRPYYLWYNCCPPNHKEGRSWSYMMGMIVRGDLGTQSESQFTQSPNNLDLDVIKQTRKDSSGRILEVYYSLVQGGNVTKVLSRPGKKDGETIAGSYQWQLQQGAYIMKSCDFEWILTIEKKEERQKIHVDVKEVHLGGVAKELFTRESMRKLIPGSGIYVKDHKNKSFYRIPQVEQVEESQLKELADLLQSRGYALPK